MRIREPPEGRSAPLCVLFFPRHVQRAAPTWPDSGDGAPVEAQHGSYSNCAIIDSRRTALRVNVANVFNTISDTMPRDFKCRSSSSYSRIGYGGGFQSLFGFGNNPFCCLWRNTKKKKTTTVGTLKQRLTTFNDNHPVKL